MTSRVTIECDRCGKPSADRRGWAYVDWRLAEWRTYLDLCPDCQALVLAELERPGRKPVRYA